MNLRFPRMTFFALGVASTILPIWLRVLREAPWWIPVGCFIAIVVARLLYGRAFRPISFAIGAASVYVCIIAVSLGRPVLANAWHQAPFDSVRWRRNVKGDTMWPVRLTMVDDLLKRGLLEHATRDSVDRLLGPPDASPYSRDWSRAYYLGPERGLVRLDGEWLVMSFGSDGRVSAVRIHRT